MKKIISGVFTVAVLAVFLFLLFIVLTRAQTVEPQGNYLLREYVVRADSGADYRYFTRPGSAG